MELAGIGGVTVEAAVPNALRTRRFYVRPAFRRGGVGRELVLQLLAHMRSNRVVSVNAAPGSVPFLGGNGLHARSARGTHTEPPKPIVWSIYKIASKAVWLGDVEPPDEAAAMEKAAVEFKLPINRLMALRR